MYIFEFIIRVNIYIKKYIYTFLNGVGTEGPIFCTVLFISCMSPGLYDVNDTTRFICNAIHAVIHDQIKIESLIIICLIQNSRKAETGSLVIMVVLLRLYNPGGHTT